MEKIRGIVEPFLREHLPFIKKAALPAVVLGAVILFWLFGGEDELTLEQNEDYGELSGVESVEPQEVLHESEGREIYVDIGGEVMDPGVYMVEEDTRLFQVVELAGGLKESADTDSINQAERVSDGQKIIIGSRDETSPYYIGGSRTFAYSESKAEMASSAVRETEYGTLVNINLANLEELQMLPGVGPSTARKILVYREEHGTFLSAEDLKNISGIGEKTYENLKDYIEV